MWNPFNKITKAALTKSTSVQLQIIAAMEEMLDRLSAETLPMPQKQVLPVPKDVQVLMDAGFINHRKVQAFNKQQEILKNEYDAKFKIYSAQANACTTLKTALELLLRARRIYGPDTLLIPLEQFMQICKKHNLVCGTFDQYTGDIPAEKLREIKRLQSSPRVCEHNSVFKITKIIKTGAGGSPSLQEYTLFDKHFNKNIPIVRECNSYFSHVLKFLDGTVVEFYHMEFENTQSYYFIAAPEKMMTGKVQEVYEPNKDPIIWGLAGNNVLIFTRWGEEANDEVIQRYEAFNRRLDVFAASLM